MKRVGKSCLLHSDLFELCRREAGAKEKESARGTMGREREEKRLFPAFSFFPTSTARFLFLDYYNFYWDTQHELLWRGE